MSGAPLTNTTTLLARFRAGDLDAKADLVARYLPRLRAWAHGRLPLTGRDLADTDDLVQTTFMRALNRLDGFESQRPGAFLAYLRTILANLVREEVRRRKARAMEPSSLDLLVSDAPSAIEQVVGQQTLEAYERALLQITEDKRLAVIMRIEFQMSYAEIAEELQQPSANATRMSIARALHEIAAQMPQ